MAFIFGIAGCSFFSLAKDSTPLQTKHEANPCFNKLYLVKEGMTKKQVLQYWGEPAKKETDLKWVYYFPEIVDQEIYLTFDAGKILIRMESSPKDWWWF